MNKLLVCLSILVQSSTCVKAYNFALINGGSHFFDPVQAGWESQCRKLGVDCEYHRQAELVGCLDTLGTDYQKDLLTEFLNRPRGEVDGIALAPCNGYELAPYIQRVVQEANIPVVVFDTDSHNSSRVAYVGTDHYFMGVTMANALKQLRPEGGTFGILTSVGKVNLEARLQGFLDELTRDNGRPGKASWRQIEGSPMTTYLAGSDIFKAQALAELNPTALVVFYQMPMRSENWTDWVDSNRHRGITIVAADSSPEQLDYLQRDYVDGLVGQLPYDFGKVSAEVLHELATTGKLQKDIYKTKVVSYTLIPLDLPKLELDQNLLGPLKYIGFVCFGVVVLTAMASMAWTVVRRNATVVRAAQPKFLFLVSVGVLVMAGAMIPLSYDDEGVEMQESKGQAICMSIPWLAFTGFATIFAALFSKTWRVNRLFGAPQRHARVVVSERDVLAPLATLLTINVAVLVCWTIIDPLTYTRQEHDGMDYWNRVISTYGACRSNHVNRYLIPLAVINMGVVAVASFQAYRARHIESEFSESKYIGMAISFLFQGFVTGIPVVVIVRDMPEAFYLVLTLEIFLLSMAVLVVIFVPKALMDYKYSNLSEKEQKRYMADCIRKSSGMPVKDHGFEGKSGSLPCLAEGPRDEEWNTRTASLQSSSQYLTTAKHDNDSTTIQEHYSSNPM